MANAFTTAFIINGMLSRSFTSSTKLANTQLDGLQNTIKRLQKAQDALNARFTNGGMSVQLYDKNIAVLQERMEAAQREHTKLTTALSAKRMADNQFSAARGNFFGTVAQINMLKSPLMSVAQTAMDFEAAMSKVGAITNATGADMAALTKEARALGERTQFTATQSAEAMSYLGMAGWKTQEILAGMPGLLNLAAAGGTDLARTADIVSDNLTAFGLSADKAMHMADVYATVITSTNTDVSMLGETMKYAAPVAQAFGASMEETAALAGLMANAGIKASQAGTSLRSGLLRLAGPPKAAAAELDKLGISLSDASKEQAEASAMLRSLGVDTGNLEGSQKMASILRQLREQFKTMGEEEKVAAGKAIFGQNAVTGWLSVLGAADGEFEKLVNQLHNCDGASEKMANRMNSNAKGAVTRFNSAVESLQISLANGFLPVIADAGDSLAKYASRLSVFAGEHPTLIKMLVYTTGTLIGLWGAYRTVMVAVTGLKAGYTTLHLTYLTLTKCSAALRASTLLTAASQKIAEGSSLALNVALTVLRAGMAATNTAFILLKGGIMKLWAILMANPWIALATIAVGAAIMIYQNWDTIKQWFITLWDNPALAAQQFIDGIKNIFGDASAWIKEKWQAISDFLSKPIFGKVNVAAQEEDFSPAIPAAHNAAGGIYGRGAFLTTFAENSGESAIPHEPTRRNIGLLARTNEIMGNPLGVGNIFANLQPKLNYSVSMPKGSSVIPQEQNNDILARFNGLITSLLGAGKNMMDYAVPGYNVGRLTPNIISVPLDNQLDYNPMQPNIMVNPTLSDDKPKTITERLHEVEQKSFFTNPAPVIEFRPTINIAGNADKEHVDQAMDISLSKLKSMLQKLQQEQRRTSYA